MYLLQMHQCLQGLEVFLKTVPSLPCPVAEGAFTYLPVKYSFCLDQMTIPLILFKSTLIQRSFSVGVGCANKTIAISALAPFTKETSHISILCKHQRMLSENQLS